MGGCSTNHRGKSGGRKEVEAKSGRAGRKTERTRAATRRARFGRRGTDTRAGSRADAEKAEMVQPKIGGAGKVISRGVQNRPERLWFSEAIGFLSGSPFVAFSIPTMYDWLCI